MTEGVDYAFGAPIPGAALAAAGKSFAGRYAVSDHAPPGRGITGAEYRELTAAGIEVFVYWEGSESWMLGGYAAGAAAARNARANLLAAEMPATMPVYFAHDIEPQRPHLAAIDACLNGAASVIGWERVGVYGGWGLIDYLAGGGAVEWLCQTVAWQWDFDGNRQGVHPRATLHQYDTLANTIAGVDVDLVRALRDTYGQASRFVAQPAPPEPPAPRYAPARLPDWWARSIESASPSDANVDGVLWRVARRKVTATHDTYRYSRPDVHAPYSGPPIAAGAKVRIERVFDDHERVRWLVEQSGNFLYAGRFRPRITIR